MIEEFYSDRLNCPIYLIWIPQLVILNQQSPEIFQWLNDNYDVEYGVDFGSIWNLPITDYPNNVCRDGHVVRWFRNPQIAAFAALKWA